MIPPVLPPITVDFAVQLFRQQTVLDADALDLAVGVEAAPKAEQILPPCWGGRRDGIILAERYTPLGKADSFQSCSL